MNNIQKNTATSSIAIRKLVLAALFVALEIIVTRFFSISISSVVRIGFQAAVFALGGFFLGPLYAALAFTASDILGFFINSAGYPFNPLFTLTATMAGLVFGFVLHNKPIYIWRTVAAFLIHTLLVNLLFRTYVLSISAGSVFFAQVITRLPTVLLNGSASCVVSVLLLQIFPEKVSNFTTRKAFQQK